MRIRGFEIVKGYENQDIHLPIRKTKNSAGYDVEGQHSDEYTYELQYE